MPVALGSPPFASGSAIQLRVYAQSLGQISINTFYYQAVTVPIGAVGWTPAILAGIFAALGIPAQYQAIMSNNATYYGLGVKLLQTPAAGALPEVWSNPAYSAVGQGGATGGANSVPLQACGLFSFGTNQPGKAGRGRLYLPFLSTTMITAATGLVTAAYNVNVANTMALMGVGTNGTINITDGITVATVQHCLHRYGSAFYYYSISGNTHQGVATQRRRGNTFGRTNSAPF